MLPKEHALEDEVTQYLVHNGGYQGVKWANREPRDFDPGTGLDSKDLFDFVESTQPDEWAQLVKLHGGRDQARRAFIERLTGALDRRGAVDVLRHGIVDLGVTVRLAFFKPAHGLTEQLVKRYEANRLTVTRQLAYEKDSNKTVDLAFFVNGIPVATSELKNKLTGQAIENAIDQYRRDRDPNNLTLSKRAAVHFAVDPDSVAMTTKLAGAATRFLPFNLGHDLGAGNPPNPDGHRTAYLWERVWQRDAWLDILARFIHVEKDERGRPDQLIFPRLHQWDAVLKLEAHTREHGAGHSYLVQHSAGSGKSHSIAWLAHRLMTLHKGDEKVFDKIVVITDRVILDRQLQDTIYQLEHAHGTVQKIDEDSAQLAEALMGEQARIIITTLQKFPFVIDKVTGMPQRRYAVIVDEAHSSQTGEAANDLKVALGVPPEKALAAAEQEEAEGVVPDAQDLLAKRVQARGRQPNLSFFAFTATPKARTLELFGTLDERDGRKKPFHLYSMRQAIQEGFILDVLASYTTYTTYWKVAKAIDEDPRYETRKAKRAIATFVALHPTMLDQKAEIIVEHFRQHVRAKIGGRAKAMVVTSSRLHAVKYKRALDAYINLHGYQDVRTLVAFSGRVYEGDLDPVSESSMNKFPESRTAEAFRSDEYQVLVVAEKFQTGFDEPLLHTMYVDKVLLGVAAVQTLSRLNRIHPEKSDTFVLDFRNETDDIRRAFDVYHGATVAAPTDPNALYDSRHALDEYGVLRSEEITEMVRVLLADKSGRQSALVHAALAPAVDRFHALDDLRKQEFRDRLDGFVRVYSFLSQVVSFQDTALERDYIFCRALGALIRRRSGDAVDLGGQVELTHLRQVLTSEGRVVVDSHGGEVRAIYNPEGDARPPEEEPLSRIVRDLNERYGMNLSEAHRLHLEAMALDMASDPEVRLEASANSFENFRLEFDKRFTSAITKEMQRNETFSLALLNDDELRAEVAGGMAVEVYTRARVAWQREIPIGDLLARDEDAYLEFKSTLEWDLKESRRNKALRTPALKTVAAFLNSRYGGTLVIGVADDRGMVGLEHDFEALHREGKDDADWFQLHLGNLIQEAVGPAAAARITTQIHRVDGHDICRVHVEPSSRPVYVHLTDAGESLFVRLNGRTSEIKDHDEVARYVEDRWGSRVGAEAESKPALRLVKAAEADKYGRHLPLYGLEAAAGHFLYNRPAEDGEPDWIEVPESLHPREGMFVVRVRGKSMEPRIADGSYAVLRFPVEGSRNGRIVLLELTEAEDPEGGGCYTLKRWRSEKTAAEESEGGWQHERIVLESLNPDVPSITLTNAEGARVIAEFVATV